MVPHAVYRKVSSVSGESRKSHEEFSRLTNCYESCWTITSITLQVFLVLDNFMLTGPDFLFKFAVAILMESKRDLLTLDFEGVLKHFR